MQDDILVAAVGQHLCDMVEERRHVVAGDARRLDRDIGVDQRPAVFMHDCARRIFRPEAIAVHFWGVERARPREGVPCAVDDLVFAVDRKDVTSINDVEARFIEHIARLRYPDFVLGDDVDATREENHLVFDRQKLAARGAQLDPRRGDDIARRRHGAARDVRRRDGLARLGDVGHDADGAQDRRIEPVGAVFPFLAGKRRLPHKRLDALAILAGPIGQVRGQRGVGLAMAEVVLVAGPFGAQHVGVGGP